MKLTIKKTDKRHTGQEYWQYIVIVEKDKNVSYGHQAITQKSQHLNLIREWCWQTYGSSCELDLWMSIPDQSTGKNEKWCWHTNFNNFKIYLRTEKEANWFKLKWL
jgi:hypothetical protein